MLAKPPARNHPPCAILDSDTVGRNADLLKRITIDDLRVDMYVAEIIAGSDSQLPRKKAGMVRDPRIIDKFREFGVRELVIDTSRGKDLEPESAPALREDSAIDTALSYFAEEQSVEHRELAFEWFTAKEIFTVTSSILAESQTRVRAGQDFRVSQFLGAAQAIQKSLRRNKDALIWFGKLRHQELYGIEHSVNCAVLMGVFCQSLGLSDEATGEILTGTLLQNIGESLLPESLFQKEGKLGPGEILQMQLHVDHGVQQLQQIAEMPQGVIELVQQHHERLDGSGYPLGLAGEAIGQAARMLAIVDSYDALSTKTAYREAIPPSQALKIILEDGKTKYDEALVHQFVKCLGVYPTGSLVRLESGQLAIVMEQSQTSRLKPDVKVMYNLKTKAYLLPAMLRLSSEMVTDKIITYEDPRKYGIDVTEFMPNDEDFTQ